MRKSTFQIRKRKVLEWRFRRLILFIIGGEEACIRDKLAGVTCHGVLQGCLLGTWRQEGRRCAWVEEGSRMARCDICKGVLSEANRRWSEGGRRKGVTKE